MTVGGMAQKGIQGAAPQLGMGVASGKESERAGAGGDMGVLLPLLLLQMLPQPS